METGPARGPQCLNFLLTSSKTCVLQLLNNLFITVYPFVQWLTSDSPNLAFMVLEITDLNNLRKSVNN